jgi:hypothetical protein
MSAAFERAQLPFHLPNDFGTGYRLLKSERLNQYLTAALPLLRSSRLEEIRDALVRHAPGAATVVRRINRANVVFVSTALATAGAQVFVNADKYPYRLRWLRRIAEFDLRVLHLLREPRGVVLTFMENRGWDAAFGMRAWIREQRDILRIAAEFPTSLRVYYEDLCDHTDAALARIHTFAGIPAEPFGGDFRVAEHHILGNSMRLDRVGVIVKSERWKEKLSTPDLDRIAAVAREFIGANPRDPMSEVLRHYFETES